jgi:lipopolysaccharide/colanic/teichoic acid biosynthesis glycosyltransferase
MYSSYLKRILDFLFALIGIIILSPMMILISLSLLILNLENPFFIQLRPGKSGANFKLVKFKTMNDKRDESGKLFSDADRLTRIGKFVRSTSLDELPQLFNVLRGDMSLIGPRPLLVRYMPLYNERQTRRHEVRPGITGWAQVNGRNSISWADRFELDIYYIENISFWLDVKILLLTVKKVFKREGINAQGTATMEAFKGNFNE